MSNPRQRKRRRLFLDGRRASENEYMDAAGQLQGRLMQSENTILGFSTTKAFEKWISSSPKANLYHQQKKRMESALKLIDEIGAERATEHFLSLRKGLTEASESVNAMIAKLSENRVPQAGGLAAVYKTLLAPSIDLGGLRRPKRATVLFYRDPGYKRQFDWWQGFFHISTPVLSPGDDNDLSSIQVYGSGITLFGDPWWRGRWFTFVGASISISNLGAPDINFDDITSSFWFWA